MQTQVTINSRGVVTLPAKIRKAMGFQPNDQLIAETTSQGLLLRPTVTLPLEMYTSERVQEFDAADLASPLAKSEPKLIVEVLSPSTAAYDRGLKFSHYRSLPSLQEYVLIDLDTRAVDSYTLGADGLWVLHPFAANETVLLASVALPVTAAQLFAEV